MQYTKPDPSSHDSVSLRVCTIVLLLSCSVVSQAYAETPGEQFDRFIRERTKLCANHKLARGENTCDILKLKPANPLATPEGRFAQSIKIPNPIPANSDYRPRMTSQEYFDHVCKTQAGEFIYKKIENVRGIYMMRPRASERLSNSHLLAPEDPFLDNDDSKGLTFLKLVGPSGYKFVEVPRAFEARHFDRSAKSRRQQSGVDSDAPYSHYSGFDGTNGESLNRTFVDTREAQYGYTWRGIVRPNDRELGIGVGELIILDLRSGEVLAVLRGFEKFELLDRRAGVAGFQWIKRCPIPNASRDEQESDFIKKVLIPIAN